MKILAIETSCDETAVALIETRGEGLQFECKVVNSLIHSQAELHSAYGGVYPGLAKREHEKILVPLLQKLFHGLETTPVAPWNAQTNSQNPDLYQSFATSNFLQNKPDIDYIAVTEGPGLEPTLWVGITAARIIAEHWSIPIIPVNHMEGHIVGSLLNPEAPFNSWQRLKAASWPGLALLISGGHTELVRIYSIGNYEIIGQTKDDALGEAYDKAARLLGLSYPGGPHLARLAQEARNMEISSPVSLPRPMIRSGDLSFSFSGLKTAVLYAVRDAEKSGIFDDTFKKGLAREFEAAITETLLTKIRLALDDTEVHTLIIGGGVSANTFLLEHITKLATEYTIPLYAPSRHVSGDNALMIALAAALNPQTKTPGEIRAHGTKQLG